LPPAARRGIQQDIRAVWQLPASADLPYPRHALIRFAHSAGRLDTVRAAVMKGDQAAFAAIRRSVVKEVNGGS
jgi:hypothetical protein